MCNFQSPGYAILSGYELVVANSLSFQALLDYEAYYMNLTDALVKNKPTWLKEYSAKVSINKSLCCDFRVVCCSMQSSYNMTRLLPADWADLVERFRVNDELLQLFFK